jgi:hypothetical protein
VLAMQAQML